VSWCGWVSFKLPSLGYLSRSVTHDVTRDETRFYRHTPTLIVFQQVAPS
jgi:hypothetical protein